MISIILPTYNEAQNIRRIIPAISKVFKDCSMDGEVIVVDDDSPDGTASVALSLAGSYPVRVHVRKKDRGLSRAVIEGFGLAQWRSLRGHGRGSEPSGRENTGHGPAYP